MQTKPLSYGGRPIPQYFTEVYTAISQGHKSFIILVPVRARPSLHRLDEVRPQIALGRLRGVKVGPGFGRAKACAAEADQVLHADGVRGC